MGKQLYKVEIGDFSGDGHQISKDFCVLCSHPASEMRTAYMETCKKLKVQMSHSSFAFDYEFPQLLSDYQDNMLTSDYLKLFHEHGFDFRLMEEMEDDFDESYLEYDMIPDPKGLFHLFMWFISYSLEGFEYELFEMESINISHDNGFVHSIGYGLFN